jgi:hypothetical protein
MREKKIAQLLYSVLIFISSSVLLIGVGTYFLRAQLARWIIGSAKFGDFVECLSDSENVILVEPDISANRVIEACKAVISMPFTSTALIALELGKPTCYYDPFGLIQLDDSAAHGIEVVKGPSELASWLKRL